MNKNELRKDLLDKRQALPPALRERYSQTIMNRLAENRDFQDAQSVFIYLSVRSEVQTDKIIKTLLKQGRTVCVPVVSRTTMYAIRITEQTEYEVSPMGIPQPPLAEGLIVPSPELTVVPIVGFDPKRNRIGYGGGYYDRFLKDYAGEKIGLAFEAQRVEEIPREEFDVALDAIITEKECYDGNREREPRKISR